MGTLLDLASLVMIPSGVKEDKLYSVKPTDGSGDFTFSRNSDIQATRVNSSGLIEKAKVNNVTYSNDFSNWVNTNTTETSGQSGYDGSSDAWLIDKSATDGRIGIAVSGSGLVTMSVYAKAGTKNWIKLSIASTGQVYAFFDLSSGSIGTSGTSVIDSTIDSIGSGWYRVSMTFSAGYGAFNVWVADDDNDTSGTSGNILIQDAQLNHGLIAQDYVETTTTSVVEGITADLPRLDYSGGASCPSLLLEGSRTNNVLQSEYFGTYWSPNQMSVSSNVDTSPEGVVNAGLLIPSTSSTSTHRIRGVVSVAAGQNHTFSCFFKKENYAYAQLRSGTGWQINVDLNDGSFTTSGTSLVDGDVEDYGNGWYRAYVVGSEAGTSQGFDISVFNSDSFGGFAGDGTSGVYAYGAQVEAGSYPTSYIPTYGASAQRNADSCSKTSATDLIGQTEGTLFAEVKARSLGENRRIMFTYEDGNNFIMLTITNSNTLRFLVFAGASIQADMSTAISAENVKLAGAYKANDFVFYVNGVQIGSDTSGSVPTTSDLYLGVDLASALPLSDELKQAMLFKTRLTNAELAALTTL